MSSRKQAIIAATLCLTIPMMFWLGAAVLALVVLRQSWEDARAVVLWSLLPAIAWFSIGDPLPLITGVGSCLLAYVLRRSVRLEWVMQSAALLGLGIYFLLPTVIPDILSAIDQALQGVIQQTLLEQPQVLLELEPYLSGLIQGIIAAIYLLVVILCLLLGRYWQSKLYNPGGFGVEFKQLKMPLGYSIVSVLLMLGLSALPVQLAGFVPVVTVPMVFAGLALLHYFASKKAGSIWIVAVYIALFVFGPYTYTLLIFLALLDSLIGFRTRFGKDTA